MTGLFWKTAAGILITMILVPVLGKQQQEIALMAVMAGCIMAVMAAMVFLEPVLTFLRRLEAMACLQTGVLGSMLKITGIAMVSEITQMLCRDGGSGALAKGIQLLSAAVILSLSLPVFETMLTLLQELLGGL